MRDFFLMAMVVGALAFAIGFIGWVAIDQLDKFHARLRILEETRPIRE